MDTQALALLQDIVGRETHSAMQYVHDAYPWTTAAGDQALQTLQSLSTRERDALIALTRFFQRRRLPLPIAVSYPSDFTTMNFLALSHLLRRLIDDEQRLIAALEKALPSVRDPEARPLVENLLNVKRQDLESLQQLHADTAAAVP